MEQTICNPAPDFRPPTLADVGRMAGVSAMTASIVLNGGNHTRRPLSDDTRARVLDAAAQLDYRPNAAAQALARLPRSVSRPSRP